MPAFTDEIQQSGTFGVNNIADGQSPNVVLYEHDPSALDANARKWRFIYSRYDDVNQQIAHSPRPDSCWAFGYNIANAGGTALDTSEPSFCNTFETYYNQFATWSQFEWHLQCQIPGINGLKRPFSIAVAREGSGVGGGGTAFNQGAFQLDQLVWCANDGSAQLQIFTKPSGVMFGFSNQSNYFSFPKNNFGPIKMMAADGSRLWDLPYLDAHDCIAMSRPVKMLVTTVAAAPSAVTSGAGAEIYVSDGDSGQPCKAVSDGTTWRRIALGPTIAHA